MFSGIIDSIGRISRSQPTPAGRAISVTAPGYWAGVASGASIAVDGVCLTVTGIDGDDAHFDVISETLRRTTLDDLQPGCPVNLQKCLAVGDRIDGHFVQGHVDAIGTIIRVEDGDADRIVWIDPGADAMQYMIPKGSVTVDGISLTIAAVDAATFSVALIPATLDRTTIGHKAAGDKVNIETDILVRAVVHRLNALNLSGRGGLSDEAAAFFAAQGAL